MFLVNGYCYCLFNDSEMVNFDLNINGNGIGYKYLEVCL